MPGIVVKEVPYELKPGESVLREGRVSQIIPGHDPPWQERTAVLTHEVLGFCEVGSKVIRDHVLLTEVQSVQSSTKDFSKNLSYSVVKAEEERQAAATVTEGLQRKRQIINIFTSPDGPFNGRSYPMRVDESSEEFAAWSKDIDLAAKRAIELKRTSALTPFARAIDLLSSAFRSVWVEGFFGLLIAANFFVNMAEAELVPVPGSIEDSAFNTLDIIFTSLFTFELVWNMCVTPFFHFWTNGWNIFDFIVVVFSLLFLVLDGLSAFSVLRFVSTLATLSVVMRDLAPAVCMHEGTCHAHDGRLGMWRPRLH